MSNDDFVPSREVFQNFHVYWNRLDQSFEAIKRRWSSDERPVPVHFRPLMEWIYRSRSRGIQYLGIRFKDIHDSKLDIGDDSEWHFSHALGRGGFGAVAMFEKRDAADNTVEDQVAIKTARSDKRLAVDTHRVDLSTEAALMSQTNDVPEDGMLILRHFKWYRTDSQWKYYFEYCPYGDLERLRIRYKAYGRYLPELFLWHTLYWLAMALKQYTNENEWRVLDTDDWGSIVPDGFLLHSDIKTQNILLGPPDPDMSGYMTLYPIPRIADLGLAGVIGAREHKNKAAHLVRGTPPWHPPELRWSKMNRRTQFYPFGDIGLSNSDDVFRKAGHRITSKANVWAIGAVMFSITSLREATFLSDIIDDIIAERVPPPTSGESTILDSDFGIIAPQQYSVDILSVIKRCVSLKPEDRPDEDELLEIAKKGYMDWLDIMRAEGVFGDNGDNRDNSEDDDDIDVKPKKSISEAVQTDAQYKLYYRRNEIDRAPDNYSYDHPGRVRSWWSTCFASDLMWLPPDWGKLWPVEMPDDVAVPKEWPHGYKDLFEQMRDRVIADKMAAAAAAGGGRRRRRRHHHGGHADSDDYDDEEMEDESDHDIEDSDDDDDEEMEDDNNNEDGEEKQTPDHNHRPRPLWDDNIGRGNADPHDRFFPRLPMGPPRLPYVQQQQQQQQQQRQGQFQHLNQPPQPQQQQYNLMRSMNPDPQSWLQPPPPPPPISDLHTGPDSNNDDDDNKDREQEEERHRRRRADTPRPESALGMGVGMGIRRPRRMGAGLDGAFSGAVFSADRPRAGGLGRQDLGDRNQYQRLQRQFQPQQHQNHNQPRYQQQPPPPPPLWMGVTPFPGQIPPGNGADEDEDEEMQL